MPRLPTIRVIGSQAISTSWRPPWDDVRASCVAVIAQPSFSLVLGERLPGTLRAGDQRWALPPPLGLAVERVRGDGAQPAHRRAVDGHRVGRQLAARRLVHERHELVREAGHRAADADAADVRAAADAVEPAALG